jgi:site-specific DNA recombinase
MVDVAKRRRIPEFIGMSRQLDDVTLVYQIRKPFDVLTEGLLVSLSRDDRI